LSRRVTDSRTGSISIGLDADFAILDADLAAIKPDEICQASVRQTWLRGQLAHVAAPPPRP
jgi:predicted amidohydrolase YtcJ